MIPSASLRYVLLPVLLLTSCSQPEKASPEFAPSKVVERIGGAENTPEWATGVQPMFEEKGEVIFVNTITMSGDSRPEACVGAASDKARGDFSRHVKDAITVSGQLNETSASSDPATESNLAYISQLKLSGLKVVGRYWEKVEESDSSGGRVLRVRCAAKVGIAKNLLAQQLKEATNKSAGNPELRQKLLEAQKKFLDNVGEETNTGSADAE